MITYSEIYRRAIPLGLANMSLVALVFTDMIMLGQHQLMEMATSSLLMQAYLIILVLGEGLVFGFSPMYGRVFELDNSRLRYQTIIAMLFVLVLYSLIGLILLLNLGWLTGLLVSTEGLAESAELYIAYLGLSIFPNLMFILAWELLAFAEKEKVVLVGALCQFVVNALANYIFIYGHFGAPELGIVGAGIATLISSIVGSLILILVYFKVDRCIQDLFIAFRSPKRDLISIGINCSKIGFPIGITMLVTIGFLSSSVLFMTNFGVTTVAAHSAVLQFNEVIVVFALGFGEFAAIKFASMPILSQRHALRTLRKIIFAGSYLFIPILFISFLFKAWISDLFFDPSDPSFQDATVLVSNFATISIPLLIINLILLIVQGALRGRGIVVRPALLITAVYWVIVLPLLAVFVLIFDASALAVWIGLFVGFLSAAILLLLFFVRTNLVGEVLQEDC